MPARCSDVAHWITSNDFDPAGLDHGLDSFESANLPASSVSPSEIRSALFNGSLVSFNMVSGERQTLCSFVSTWDAPMNRSGSSRPRRCPRSATPRPMTRATAAGRA